jgi:catechol 2,3-dioxygenase-like lactoylglutathione lyase family enzyme
MTLIDPIDLTLYFAMLTSIEVPTAVAQAALPDVLDAIEIRPGVALAALLVLQVQDGCEHPGFGALPGYAEAVVAIQVAPTLRRSLPRLAFYVSSMATSLPAADRFLEEVHWIGVRPARISARRDAGGRGVIVSDADGPIFEMADRHPEPAYVPKQTLSQVFTVAEGRVAMYHELLSGSVHEHQRRSAHVRLFPHPFLAALDGVGPTPRAYLQMTGQPGLPVRQLAERPRWVE